MDCRDVRARILESLDDMSPDAAMAAHLANCPTCSSFARGQAQLHAQLVQALTPPTLNAAFRAGLVARIKRESRQSRTEGLLERVHFVSCALAILVLTLILPVSSASVLAAGVTTAVASYVGLSIVRNSFEDDLIESEP